MRIWTRPNRVLVSRYRFRPDRSSRARENPAMVRSRDSSGAASSTLAITAGAMSSSATVWAAVTTASAMHRKITLGQLRQAAESIKPVFCHML